MVLSDRIYLLICSVLGIVNVYGDNFEEDYFYASHDPSLRTSNCGSKSQNFVCGLTCPKYHVCVKRQCLCFDSPVKRIARTHNTHDTASNDFNVSGFIDLTKSAHEEGNAPKPSLRHHIAHFCPNLEAKTCVTKCMKVGKPAFCSKDRKCYCGHRYSENTKENDNYEKQMYAQFKDLYKKYFGDNYRPNFSEEE